MDAIPSPEVYRSLVEYQQSGADGWALREVIRCLHRWAEVFRLRFKLEIPEVPLRIASLRRNCLGHFNPGHNDFGLENEIAIDRAHVVRGVVGGTWHDVLGTLAHEQLHFWQQLQGHPAKPGPGNYHNAQYRSRAADCGLLVSSRGVSEGYVPGGPFLALLAEYGVTVPELRSPPDGSCPPAGPRVGSKLKKWTCGCTNVRVAVADFRARCLKCGRPFTRCG